MSQLKGYANPYLKGSLKGCRNPDLNNSNATSPCNATSPHHNSTQLQHHLKPRRGLEESKTNRSSRVTVTASRRDMDLVLTTTLTDGEATA